MTALKIFENTEFGRIRLVLINDEPWIVGKDVAKALGYEDTNNALKKHVDTSIGQTLQTLGNIGGASDH